MMHRAGTARIMHPSYSSQTPGRNRTVGEHAATGLLVMWSPDLYRVAARVAVQRRATLPALRRLKDAGKVRAIGITGYPLKIFRTVLAQAKVDTVLSYCRYTLADYSRFHQDFIG